MTAKRSAVFFESDVWDAAEMAAVKMWDHGLTEDQVHGLTDALAQRIHDYFDLMEVGPNHVA